MDGMQEGGGQRSLGSSLMQGMEVLSSEHLPLGPYVDKSGSWSHFSHVPLGMHSVTVPLGPFSCHRSFTLTSCLQCPPQGSVSHTQALL